MTLEHCIKALEHRAGRALQCVEFIQLFDLLEAQAQRLQALDKSESFAFIRPVDPPSALPTSNPGQQTQLLVVADGPRREPGLFAHFSDRPLRGGLETRLAEGCGGLPVHVNCVTRSPNSSNRRNPRGGRVGSSITEGFDPPRVFKPARVHFHEQVQVGRLTQKTLDPLTRPSADGPNCAPARPHHDALLALPGHK